MADRPCLILVSGAPGAGKTTLARRLASDLRLPLLAKDEIKEALYDSLGAPDRAASQRIGAATFAVIYLIVDHLLTAGTGAMIESNFWHGRSEPELGPLVARANAVQIHCHAPEEMLLVRYEARFGRGGRHPGHFDDEAKADLIANVAAGRFAPLDLMIPTLVVDTSNGYAPSYDDVVAFATVPPPFF